MKKRNNRQLSSFLFPHAPILICFAFISLLFYYPLFSGKTLLQSDIIQYEGMSRQLKEYRINTSKETYWIDNAFGGMPTYQLGAKYPADFLSPIYSFFRILPRPAHILFLYLLGGYLFLILINFTWPTALFGAISFGFSTYLLIIIQVGHNTKALAISFFPFVIAGMLLLFKRRWFWGFILSSLSIGMQVRANHYQMTYYLFLLMGIFFLVYGFYSWKKNRGFSFLKSLLILFVSGTIALGFNSTSLMATSEYTDFSTRGKSELTINPDGSPKEQSTGLDFDYITEYSYGIFESLNLIVPRIQGGGSREDLGRKHGIYDFLIQNGVGANQALQFSKNVPTYWGTQPILEAPAYIGISVFFFALMSLFLIRGPLRDSLALGILFSLLLSWGKNLSFLTEFFVNYVPLYNKFRAVSSLQVVLEFCFPVLAAMGLHHLFYKREKIEIKYFLKIAAIPFLILSLVYISKGLFSFTGINDSYFVELYGPSLVSQIKEARISIFESDVFRALLFCITLTVLYYLFYINKIKKNSALILILLVLTIDLVGVANRYIDRDAFVSPKRAVNTFQITSADLSIQKDTSRFRVFEPRLGLTGARTSFFHNALGGYHGAKPRRFEELFDAYKTHQNTGILDFLNVKYIISSDQENGSLKPLLNPNALGPVWFVNEIKEFRTLDELMQALKEADFNRTALVFEKDLPHGLIKNYTIDSLTKIHLISAKPDYLKYQVNNTSNAFAVFSEMYYPKGWKAFVDGKEFPIFNVNYVLRGLEIPANVSEVEFRFEPKLIGKGTFFRWLSLVFFVLGICVLGYFQYFRKTR